MTVREARFPMEPGFPQPVRNSFSRLVPNGARLLRVALHNIVKGAIEGARRCFESKEE